MIHTISDSQIEALEREAGAAGDLEQVAVCMLALDETDGCQQDAEPGTPVAEVLDRYGLELDAFRGPLPQSTIDDARAECARVISDAEASADTEV